MNYNIMASGTPLGPQEDFVSHLGLLPTHRDLSQLELGFDRWSFTSRQIPPLARESRVAAAGVE